MPKGRKSRFSGGKYPQIEKPISKIKKRPDTKEISCKSKKLELNCTNLKLNSKKTCSDWAKTPDPSISSGLREKQNVHILNNLSAITFPIKGKNKTIRVLLDSGSSDDLLFMKKGYSKCIYIVKRVVPQSWGTSNGAFITDRVGDMCECVCVCELDLQSGWAALITRCQPQGWLTHPSRLQHHTPLDSAHQFPPGENVNWWVSLGNIDRTVTTNLSRHSMVTFWCPAWRVTMWHLGAGSRNLPVLPFTDFQRVCNMRSQCNYLQYNSDTDSGEGGQSIGAKVGWRLQLGLISRGWDGATLATRHTGGRTWEPSTGTA